MKTITTNLILRFYSDDDLELMIQYLNNKNVTKETANIPFPFTKEEALERVDFIKKGLKKGTNYVFTITKSGEDKLIGQIGLHLDKDHNKAEIGYWIGEPFWGNGYASEANKAILKFGFEELNLNKIFATHFLDNPASGKVLINSKMIKEAELIDHYKKGESYQSVNQYRLTKDEFENLNTSNF